jgi:hypothetical protein
MTHAARISYRGLDVCLTTRVDFHMVALGSDGVAVTRVRDSVTVTQQVTGNWPKVRDLG